MIFYLNLFNKFLKLEVQIILFNLSLKIFLANIIKKLLTQNCNVWQLFKPYTKMRKRVRPINDMCTSASKYAAQAPISEENMWTQRTTMYDWDVELSFLCADYKCAEQHLINLCRQHTGSLNKITKWIHPRAQCIIK